MLISEFINKAAEQHQSIDHINITKLGNGDMIRHLDAKCICCGGDVDVDAIEEIVEQGEDYVRWNTVGWRADLFCDGCSDHLDADVLRHYGAITDEEYDRLCNPFEEANRRCIDDLPF
jgi:hypothetical protein